MCLNITDSRYNVMYMAQYFDEALWRQSFQRQDWYLQIYDTFRQLEERAEQSDPKTRSAIKEEIYSFIEDLLLANTIVLGASGIDWDKEREPIKTIVMHHTQEASGMTLSRLNAMHLIRLYAARYASGILKPDCRGQAIWSDHIREGQQVFWGYHWLVRLDGTSERLLPDESIARHTGEWAVNKCSIGICIDDDFSHSQPSEVVLRACAKLIKDHYPHISQEAIVGHRQVKEGRTCPGELFLSVWRQKLLDCLASI